MGEETMKDPLHILGIDPGLHGALAFFEISTHRVMVFDMPVTDGFVDGTKIASIIDLFGAKLNTIHAVIENVSSMPRQAGAFNFGFSTGLVHGVLQTLGIPITKVSPVVWKGASGLRKTMNETQEQNKTRARRLAADLWPDMEQLFERVKDDGRAEACLLARWFGVNRRWEK